MAVSITAKYVLWVDHLDGVGSKDVKLHNLKINSFLKFYCVVTCKTHSPIDLFMQLTAPTIYLYKTG